MNKFLFLSLFVISCSLDIKDDEHAGAVTAGNTGAIAGIITIPDSLNPVALQKASSANQFATVYLYFAGSIRIEDSTSADSLGRYAFTDLDTGYYALKAMLSNGQSFSVDSIHVVSELTTRCDFEFGSTPPQGSGILYTGPVFLAGQSSHQIQSLPGFTGGYWYSYDDRDSNGHSFTEPEHSSDFLDSVRSGNGRIRANLHLRPGRPYPWAGIGFNWASGNAVNLSFTDGLCVIYQSNTPLWVSFTLTESPDTNTYGKTIPATDSLDTVSILWQSMDWNYKPGESVSISEALLRAEGINFQTTGAPGLDSLDTHLEIEAIWLGSTACQ